MQMIFKNTASVVDFSHLMEESSRESSKKRREIVGGFVTCVRNSSCQALCFACSYSATQYKKEYSYSRAIYMWLEFFWIIDFNHVYENLISIINRIQEKYPPVENCPLSLQEVPKHRIEISRRCYR